MNKLLIAGVAVSGYLVYRHFTIPPASGTMTTLPPSVPPASTGGKSTAARVPLFTRLISVSPGIPPVPATGCPQGQAPTAAYDNTRKAWVQTCR